MEEIWRDIRGFEGLYQVSNLGNVKSAQRVYYSGKRHSIIKQNPGAIRQPSIDKNGYRVLTLRCEGKMFYKRIARLVADAFIPNPDDKPCVDHIDTIKTNDMANNLRWVSYSENMMNELTSIHRSNCQTGSLNHQYGKTLDKNKRSKSVIQMDINGCFIRKWISAVEINKSTGFLRQAISACCLGKRKTAYNYKWEYDK